MPLRLGELERRMGNAPFAEIGRDPTAHREWHDPEIVCLTEAVIGLYSRDGHTICSPEDYGYPVREGRRKVLLWSKRPWERVDDVGTNRCRQAGSLPASRKRR